ncbi:Serpin family [Trema orientale]|uniref:Serpin family n=1 Tax=Trema orientale TaxID=63057 RepID=A0A2P5E7K2_TREOI|nr:Serpin family [Trema orientale]
MDFCTSGAMQLILDELKRDGNSDNIVMSPLSINMMLNMVASGSGGKTLEQFLEFLGSKDISDFNDNSSIVMSLLASDETETIKPSLRQNPMAMLDLDSGPYPPLKRPKYSSRKPLKKKHQPPLFSLANALWVDNGFQLIPSFKETTESIYKAQVKNVDLVTEEPDEGLSKHVDLIVYIENETKGLIKDLLSPHVILAPPLCLANALYFKGAWEHAFDASMTLNENFYLLNGETIRVPLMTIQNVHRSYASFDDYKVLKLRYQRGQCTNKQFSMYFFLPHKRNGLQDMIEKFSSDSAMLQPSASRLKKVKLSHVWIPKLKFSYYVDAKKLIKDRGLTLPFSPEGADFTNMINATNVFINEMLHKSCIEVNEKGTEAAAATFAGPRCGSARGYKPPPLPSFVADHPFMFTIVEEFSNLIIFTGALLNPKK